MCQDSPKKPLSTLLREKRQDELYAEMQVRMDIASLKRSLEKRKRIQNEINAILEEMAKKKKKSEN